MSLAPLSRNFTCFGGAVFGSTLLQYGLYFWLARYLGVEAYGSFSLLLTIAVLTAPLCDLGMSVALVRTCARDPQVMPEALGAALAWRLILALPTVLAAFVLCHLEDDPLGVSGLLLPMLCATLLDGLCNLCSAAFQAKERMSVSALIQIGRQVVRCAAFAGIVLVGGGIQELAYAYVVASLICAVPTVLATLRLTPIRFRRQKLVPVLTGALPFGSAILAVMLHSQSDVVMLGVMSDRVEVGLYHAGMRFFLLAQILSQTVSTVTAPLCHRLGLEPAATSSAVYRVKATGLVAIGVLASLFLCLHAELVVSVVLGPSYQGTEVVLLAIAPAILVNFLSSPIGDTLGSIGRQGSLSLACWSALTVNIGVNLILIPTYGALGAAFSTLISETLLLVILVTVAVRAGLRLDWNSVLCAPLCAATAVAVIDSLGLPSAAASALALATGIAVYALLLWLRPTPEQMTLIGRRRSLPSAEL